MHTGRLDTLVNTMEGVTEFGTRVIEPIRCVDGFTVSVQAGTMHYCTGSDGSRPYMFEELFLPFRTVEVGYPSSRPEPWEEVWKEYAEDPDKPTETVYGYVPVEQVRALIESHGGEG